MNDTPISSSTNDTKRLNRQGRIQQARQLQAMRPSRLFSWHWSTPAFQPGQSWLRHNQSEIRRGQYLSDTPGREVWRVSLPEEAGGTEILYKYTASGFGLLEGLAAHSPAVQEAANLMALSSLGIPVPPLLACGENRRLSSRLLGGYIITEFLPNTVDASILIPGKDWRERIGLRRGFCRKCMEHIAKVHASGCFHSSFHAHKILIDKDSLEHDPTLYWLDVSRCQFKPRITMAKAIALDLVTLFIDLRPSTMEIKEYCEHYLNINTDTGYTVDTLWEAMIAAAS